MAELVRGALAPKHSWHEESGAKSAAPLRYDAHFKVALRQRDYRRATIAEFEVERGCDTALVRLANRHCRVSPSRSRAYTRTAALAQ